MNLDSEMPLRQSQRVLSLHVIYDADGSLTGELVYMAKKLLGIAHCAACDITHGPRREKPEFTQLKAVGWNVPFHNIHRDEMDEAMREAVAGVLPCVVARTEGKDVLVVGPKQLDECQGDIALFEAAVNIGISRTGLLSPVNDQSCEVPKLRASENWNEIERDDDSEMSEDGVVPQPMHR